MRTAFDLVTAARYYLMYLHLPERLQCRGLSEMRKADVMCYSVQAWQYCDRDVSFRLSGDGRCRA